MPDEVSTAQSTLQRLIDAEHEAHDILEKAERNSSEIVDRARHEATERTENVRQEMERALDSRRKEVESQTAAQMKARLGQVDAEGREIERRASEHFSEAVERVVDWITRGGE